MGDYSVEFLEFWKVYPHKTEKKYAAKCYAKAIKDGAKPQDIIAGVQRYVAWLKEGDSKDWRPNPKNPSTFLNRGCYEDEYTSGIEPEQAPFKTMTQTRLDNFYKNGFWLEAWGDKPPPRLVVA